jgi:hypothetical protein
LWKIECLKIQKVATKVPLDYDSSMPTKIDLSLKNKAKSMFLSGFSSKDISEETEVKLATIKRWSERESWGSLRKKSEQQADEKLVGLVSQSKVKTIEILDPIITKLTILSHEMLDGDSVKDLSPKEILGAIESLTRMRSRILGEVVHKHDVHDSRAGVWREFIEAVKNIDKSTIKPKHFDLLE